ncbi:MAG: alpha/beta fold hydrolase [Chloroflexota bacterium]|nr:alpha/beta fold hydrolase [Chloroflexota bacterium]
MSFELPPDPRAARRARVSRWLSIALALSLVGLLAYFAFVGYEGSGELVDQVARSPDCRTPAAFGWAYEAINYDVTGDAAVAAQPDPEHCTVRPAAAGEAVVTEDGIRIAGWYIPAAASIGPAGPTVVLVHDWGGSKSEMLAWAAVLHESYNLVAFDLRNHGQSSGDQTTQGALEQLDVKAMLDWLVATKAPKQVAVLGLSMGGAAAVNEATNDDRVDALIIASTHATLANAAQARLDKAGYPLSGGGAWAILLGGLIRTGEDMSAADPVQAIARLAGRPVLILAGGKDDSIGPNDSKELVDAAKATGVDAQLQACAPAGRGEMLEACPTETTGWVLGFLTRALAAPST